MKCQKDKKALAKGQKIIRYSHSTLGWEISQHGGVKMKKLSIKADNCFIDNRSYGTYVNGENLTDIIRNQLPKTDGNCPAKISIEIEILIKN